MNSDIYQATVATPAQLFASPTIWFLLTNRCNINCHYCFNYITKNHEEMSPEMGLGILKHYLRYQQEHGIKHDFIRAHFFGGEPTLNPKTLFAIMDYLNENDVPCFPLLGTNGIIKENILNEIIARKMFFRLSFDGIKNSLRFTKSGTTNIDPHIIRTIKKVKAADLPLQLRATIHADNVHDMCQVVEFAASNGVDDVVFFPVYLENGNARIYPVRQPTIEDYIDNFLKARELAKKHNIKVQGEQNAILKSKNATIFRYPLFWLPDGNLSCSIQYSSSRSSEAKHAIVGRYLLDENKVELDTAKIEQFNNNFYNNRAQNCADCEFKKTCQGGFKFEAYTLNNQEKIKNDYFCEMARRLTKLRPDYNSNTGH